MEMIFVQEIDNYNHTKVKSSIFIDRYYKPQIASEGFAICTSCTLYIPNQDLYYIEFI